MSEIPDNTIQCVVTSPPYWGLRKYSGNQDLIWGGNHECKHEWGLQLTGKQSGGDISKYWKTGGLKDFAHGEVSQSNFCSLCGAWRGAYGLEPTPEMYVEHTIQILREIKRVLRKDGVVFWNVGDSYAGSGMGAANYPGDYQKQNSNTGTLNVTGRKAYKSKDIKPKDLCLIPFRVAIAAQQDGWWIRSVIIWNKPNPMPESVKDRPTDAYEHIIMLTKSARYYWNMEAVREEYQGLGKPRPFAKQGNDDRNDTGRIYEADNNGGRNLRNVWTFPTQPYPEAHFATYPEALPERCIKAASKEGDIILDPFAGSGTTLKVAAELNRKAIGYEISEEYCKLIIERNKQTVLL